MGRRVPIRVKAAAALAVPLAILLAVAGLEVAATAREVRDVREQTDLATASIGPSGVINAIQNERNFSGLYLLGAEGAVDLPVDTMAEARAATDASITAFRTEVGRKGGDVARIYAPALDALEAPGGVADLRAAVDGYDGTRLITVYNATADRSFQDYSRLVTALAEPTTRLTYEIEDSELRRGVQLIDLASREVDRIAQAVRQAIVDSVRGNGLLDEPDEVREAAMIVGEADREHLRLLELSTGTYAEVGEELRVESEATQVRQISRRIVETGIVDIPGLLEGVSIREDESYYGFIDDVSGMVRARANRLNAEAADRQRVILGLSGLLVLAAVVAVPLFSRSVTRPLRLLVGQAREMAERRLPEAVRSVHEAPLGEDVAVPQLEPVHVAARDEVADVADMLNTVQSTALDLAVEQAVLRRNVADAFVSLARRNQNLLGRQLDYITELESQETRPDALGDLFRLDHHATRMRRNAESLLMLAGTVPRRHTTFPAPMIDVVRAALGEVDGYQRVAIKGLQPADVAGPAVADLAHLLAELIENALRFSPPYQPVDVRGHRRAEGYALGVIDRGVGMTAHDVARANRRLANAESHTIAPSKYLGHYVTGVLAARHGIEVRLLAAPAGITATVHLPPSVIAHRPPPERGGPWAPSEPYVLR